MLTFQVVTFEIITLQLLALLYLLAFIAAPAFVGIVLQGVLFKVLLKSRPTFSGTAEFITVLALALAHGWLWYFLVPEPVIAVMCGMIGFISPLYGRYEKLRHK